jgi:nitroreductase
MLDKDLMKLIQNRRSIRRFKRKIIDSKELRDIVKAGSYAASAGNRQLWHFVIVNNAKMVSEIFKCLEWLSGAGTIDASKSPSAYIIVLLKNPNNKWPIISDGAAAIQNMMLMSYAKGIGSCWIGSVRKNRVHELLDIPKHLTIFSILALGYPDEDPIIEEVKLKEPKEYINTSGKIMVQKKVQESIISVNEFKSSLL